MKEASFYSEIQNGLDKGKTLVVYHKPGSKSINALIQDNKEEFSIDTLQNAGFVFAPFDPSSQWIVIPKQHSRELSIPFNSDFTPNSSNGEVGINNDPSEEIRYKNLVKKTKDIINETDLNKVVLSRPIDLECQDSALSLFRKLLVFNPNAMVYLFSHPQAGTWLGASPEQLIWIHDNILTTVSLAGTKAVSASKKAVWTSKELKEQAIVTDYLESELKPFVRNFVASEIETVRAGSVFHLKTTIKAELKDISSKISDILKAIHPTPAVCGTPKELAFDYIKREEGYQREFYTGFLGEFSLTHPVSADLFVNLRCMQIRDGRARIYVGGGITAESDPESEWLETVEKSKTMVKVIAFSEGE